MTSKSEWKTIPLVIDPDTTEALFFHPHEWDTVEAMSARVIPTDHDPGAREARVVVFIDRYLSGIDYIFAAADGSGFLRIEGRHADAWRARIGRLQRLYRAGLRRVDEIAETTFGRRFVDLDEIQQDAVLEELSGRPKPGPVTLGTVEPASTFTQFTTDDGLDFFDAFCLHVKQGFYADPVYGGNKDRIGWRVIGFPGPASLKDTMDGTYSTLEYFTESFSWPELIPHLRAQKDWEVPEPEPSLSGTHEKRLS